MNTFRELLAWQKAMSLVTEVYRVTRSFPKEELYCLTAQIRRAAISVPSNIAEGQSRPTGGQFRQFLGHAKGSMAELETQLLIAKSLGYLDEPNDLFERVAEVSRLLAGLLRSLVDE
jgi:four helix bundle protein